MKINKEIIEKLNPCKDRFDNFVNNNPSFDGNLKDFISLDNITYDYKVWVVTRLFTKKQNVKWAIACAESVLHIYEETYPKDKRPRQAIEAATAWVNNPCEETRQSASSAAASSAASAATASASSAAYYASSAAHAASANAAYYAASAAATTHSPAAYYAYYAYYAAASAAYAAAAYYATYATAFAEKQQEDLNLLFMLEAE